MNSRVSRRSVFGTLVGAVFAPLAARLWPGHKEGRDRGSAAVDGMPPAGDVFTYDNCGRPIEDTDDMLSVTKYSYDI
jgi:hypothetical protein